jgi:hypothetical protein
VDATTAVSPERSVADAGPGSVRERGLLGRLRLDRVGPLLTLTQGLLGVAAMAAFAVFAARVRRRL